MAKIPYGEKVSRGNILSANCPHGECPKVRVPRAGRHIMLGCFGSRSYGCYGAQCWCCQVHGVGRTLLGYELWSCMLCCFGVLAHFAGAKKKVAGCYDALCPVLNFFSTHLRNIPSPRINWKRFKILYPYGDSPFVPVNFYVNTLNVFEFVGFPHT